MYTVYTMEVDDTCLETMVTDRRLIRRMLPSCVRVMARAVRPSVRLSVCLSVRPSVRLSVCLSVCHL